MFISDMFIKLWQCNFLSFVFRCRAISLRILIEANVELFCQRQPSDSNCGVVFFLIL